MPVQRGIGSNPIPVLTTDTLILADGGAGVRHRIDAFLAVNDTGAGITMNVYDSPDATSASGDLLLSVIIAANATATLTDLIGHGFASGRNIVATASSVGVDAKITYTLFTGGA